MGRLLGIAIWIITAASVWMFVSGRWWFPEAISEHGPRVDSQFKITIVVVGIAFDAAQIGLGWVVWKYRDRADSQRATYSHGNNRLEIVWTVVTAVIFISLAIMGQRVWASLHLHSAPPGSYTVEVVAQQFAWNFHYSGKDGAFGRTDPQLIDDTTNPVGLDDTGTVSGSPSCDSNRTWCRAWPFTFISRLLRSASTSWPALSCVG